MKRPTGFKEYVIREAIVLVWVNRFKNTIPIGTRIEMNGNEFIIRRNK